MTNLTRLAAALKEIDPQVLRQAGLSAGRIRTLLLRLPQATPQELLEITRLLERLVQADTTARAATHFLPFVRAMWPGFVEGGHIRQMAQAFEDVVTGRKKRVIINMPPRHSKSEMTSYMLPAWYIGRYPDRKIMIATHTFDLAASFGRRIRNLMQTAAYQAIFPGVSLAEDSKAQGKWNTAQGGEFFAAGVGSNIAGRGADLLVMDDLTSEQDAQDGEHNPMVWERAWMWYLRGPRQRLQPGAAMLLCQTRWHLSDTTGRLLDNQKRGGEKWHVIRFPALLPSGRQLWPELWPLDEIEALRDELEPPIWAAQYMQDPTADVAAILPRRVWQPWTGDLPEIRYTATFVDTAHTVDKHSDWSAWTTWGLFRDEASGRDAVLMLEARKDRLEYPDLKLELLKHYKEMQPDLIEIECKAAGTPLVQELRRLNLPVAGFTPTRAHGDKIRRLRNVTDMFADGLVFYPDRTWAREVIEECAAFPRGQFDDFVDTVSAALRFFRQGNLLRIAPEDDADRERQAGVDDQCPAYY